MGDLPYKIIIIVLGIGLLASIILNQSRGIDNGVAIEKIERKLYSKDSGLAHLFEKSQIHTHYYNAKPKP